MAILGGMEWGLHRNWSSPPIVPLLRPIRIDSSSLFLLPTILSHRSVFTGKNKGKKGNVHTTGPWSDRAPVASLLSFGWVDATFIVSNFVPYTIALCVRRRAVYRAGTRARPNFQQRPSLFLPSSPWFSPLNVWEAVHLPDSVHIIWTILLLRNCWTTLHVDFVLCPSVRQNIILCWQK
jgi:hypothetical protein